MSNHDANTNHKSVILSADDESTNRMIIETYFNKEYTLLSATNGKEALDIFLKTPNIDLILLDIMMPEMDGITVCEEIRKTDKGKDIPIIFLSAKSDTDDIIKGLDKGGNDYLSKPFRPAELKARVKSQLKVRELQKLKIQNENLNAVKNLMVRMNHEIRNALTIVNASIRMLKVGDDDKKNIENIFASTGKIIDILKKLDKIEEIKSTDYVQGVKMLDID